MKDRFISVGIVNRELTRATEHIIDVLSERDVTPLRQQINRINLIGVEPATLTCGLIITSALPSDTIPKLTSCPLRISSAR
jgi:hypothetical protein